MIWDFVINYYHKFFLILLIVYLALIIYYFKEICLYFKPVKGRTWLFLFLIIFGSFLLKFFLIPNFTLTFEDEYSQAEIAFNIVYNDKFCLCSQGIKAECYDCNLDDIWPGVFPLIYSIFFNIFGDDIGIVNYLNIIISCISIGLFFLLSFLFSKKEDASLIATLIFSLVPVLVKISTTGSLETSSVFFVLLSALFFWLWFCEKDSRFFLLFCIGLSITLNVRTENYLFIPLLLFFLLIYHKKINFKIFYKEDAILSYAILFLGSFFSFALIYYGLVQESGMEGWTPNPFVAIHHFFMHFWHNILFFLSPFSNLMILVPLVFFGSFILYKKDKIKFYVLAVSFLLFFVFYSCFDIGQFVLLHDSSRYAALLFVPLLLLTVEGIDMLIKYSKKYRKYILIFLVLFSLFSFSLTYENVTHVTIINNLEDDLEEIYGLIIDTEVRFILNPDEFYLNFNEVQFSHINESKYNYWIENNYVVKNYLPLENLPPEFIFIREEFYAYNFSYDDFDEFKEIYDSKSIFSQEYGDGKYFLEIMVFEKKN